jgi:predicted nucleic acid-binding protein/GNAT superfamily N-acetyltransferase
MQIDRIDEQSEYLSQVIELWRRNSRTLGFFPEGAFEDHARRRCILIACDGQGHLLGYLLFRVVQRRKTWPQAIIVHLCTNEKLRGQGIAEALVDKLRAITCDYLFTIKLSCRRDYDANSLWPKLGFFYAGEKIGRSGQPVLVWQMRLRPLPLDTLLHQKESEHKLCAAIDANVLYRLQDATPDDSEAKTLSEEAKALQEDWLSDDISLLLTDETLNEIQRNDDPDERARRLAFAQQYERVVTEIEDVQAAECKLAEVFPPTPSESTSSDIKQLSHAVAGGAHFFITQDEDIRKRSDLIHAEFGTRILSPGELIGHIDEVLREAEYQPNRLAGSCVLTSKMRSEHIPSLFSYFGYPHLQERKRQLQSRLRSYVAQPDKYECLVSWQQDGSPLSLIVYERTNPNELLVPLLRITRSPLSATVTRQLVAQAVLVSASEGRSVTHLAQSNCEGELEQALLEIGFTQVNDGWVKINLSGACRVADLARHLAQIGEHSPSIRDVCKEFTDALSKAIEAGDTVTLAEIERRLWPAKIADADIPSFVVSIRPVWAQHLFDEELARQTLWGARADLAFSHENVYYRSKRNSRKIRGPGRVLWYVTYDRHHLGSKHIRAVSHLEEVVAGKPKDLFTQFKRLGIYQWNDLMRITEGDPGQEIMALRFSNTELFRSPVSLDDLRRILRETENKTPVLQSPQPVSPQSFARIYKMGAVPHQ